MKRIALISDNHRHDGHDLLPYLEGVDEIWHAGDMGSLESIEGMRELTTFRGVYGNIDNHIVKAEFSLNLSWECEGVKVFMTHIGGYPGRYTKRVKELLLREKPQLYICGHSHICKVIFDDKLKLLHMNPGAYGNIGWHSIRTILRFTCDNGIVKDAEVVELGKKGKQ